MHRADQPLKPLTIHQVIDILALLGHPIVGDPEHRPDGPLPEDISFLFGHLVATVEKHLYLTDMDMPQVLEGWGDCLPAPQSLPILWTRAFSTRQLLREALPGDAGEAIDHGMRSVNAVLGVIVSEAMAAQLRVEGENDPDMPEPDDIRAELQQALLGVKHYVETLRRYHDTLARRGYAL